MCIYTVKKQKLKKKSSRRVRDSTERPIIRGLFTWLQESYQWKKTQYSTCICNMTCLNLCYFLRYPLLRRRLILGRSVESRIPTPEEFKFFLSNICLLSVYMHIFQIQNPLNNV